MFVVFSKTVCLIFQKPFRFVILLSKIIVFSIVPFNGDGKELLLLLLSTRNYF